MVIREQIDLFAIRMNVKFIDHRHSGDNEKWMAL